MKGKQLDLLNASEIDLIIQALQAYRKECSDAGDWRIGKLNELMLRFQNAK